MATRTRMAMVTMAMATSQSTPSTAMGTPEKLAT